MLKFFILFSKYTICPDHSVSYLFPPAAAPAHAAAAAPAAAPAAAAAAAADLRFCFKYVWSIIIVLDNSVFLYFFCYSKFFYFIKL